MVLRTLDVWVEVYQYGFRNKDLLHLIYAYNRKGEEERRGRKGREKGEGERGEKGEGERGEKEEGECINLNSLCLSSKLYTLLKFSAQITQQTTQDQD
jgi:hypothetical protein